ncbi:hypothetical protein L1987_28030 [Smallanthus sonchifolius]|uniref:Uncharacterized protein n=1 Tax=Smallanthus sonchifolius TaxID=185202 RepID=A0ACB9IDD5_9ASTR|nr:hypothetical protein L1987_28030 [Smallanthus sonchifolius]
MRLSSITLLFLIFITLGLHFASQITNCSTNHPLISLQARRSLKKVDDQKTKINKVDGNAWRSTMSKAYDAVNNEDAEIVYNIDYQGVKTHPSPTPRHP